ncbi:MAG: hypothetical protein KC591_10400 [Gemmatimonadetes bacterium]|nr:hypothetical protein [Gemmatimonadota bacterium]
MDALQLWISTALTLCILSFLWKDNPLYKLAEHLFVGISAGYYIALAWQETIRPNLVEEVARGNWIRLGAAILGVLMFTRFVPKISWLSRWPLAFVVGMYAGINVIAFASGDLILQLQSTMVDVVHDGWTAVSNVILVIGLATSLIYFYFSKEQKGALGVVSRIGIFFLMISFGASFGYTVMSRMSLAIGRTRELMVSPATTGILLLAVAVFLFVWGRRQRSTGEGA